MLSFKKTFILLGFLFLTLTSCMKLDQTMKVFFPKELSDLHKIQTDFPVFWWNFVVVDLPQADSPKLEAICKDLKTHIGKEFKLVICGNSGQIPYDLLGSWSQDVFSRERFDSTQMNRYLERMNSALTLAAFSPQKQFLDFLRFDPFQSWKEFEAQMTKQSLNSIELKDGYFRVKGTSKMAIPVQFTEKPSVAFVKPVMDTIDSYHGEAFLLGVHGSSYRNEVQVKKDLEVVSVVTGIVFVLFLAYLVWKAGFTVLFLALPVSISVYISALIIQLIYGSIHGLTLSFGSGVIGLALDYGLHGLLGKESHKTWHSNFVGMLTTLCGVLILVCSGIPLIRQMMMFSTIGLIIAFAIYFFLFKYFKNFFNVKNFKMILPYFKGSQVLMVIIVVFGLMGFKNVQMNMDLKKMNLMSEKELDYSKMLFAQSGQSTETYMLIHDLQKKDFFQQEYAKKAAQQGINYQGVDLFLPNEQTQLENQQSWKSGGCQAVMARMNTEQKSFFKPFFEKECDPRHEVQSVDITKRTYLSQFVSGHEALSLFHSGSKEQAQFLEKNIPEAKSIVKSVMTFSDVLQKELRWMIPLSLLLTLIILYWYYRQVRLVICSIFPFTVGMSLFFIVASIFKIEIDLIAILGLVMVFGFSIDYGVFSTDAHFYNFEEEESDNVYTALSLASITNLLGFLPMLFAVHPVLKQFGYALFFGTLGAYLGAVYGLKYYFSRTKVAV